MGTPCPQPHSEAGQARPQAWRPLRPPHTAQGRLAALLRQGLSLESLLTPRDQVAGGRPEGWELSGMGFQLREWLGLHTTRPALTSTLVSQPLVLPGVEVQAPWPGLRGTVRLVRGHRATFYPHSTASP